MRPRIEFKFTGKPEGAHTADSRAPRGVCLFEGGAKRIYKYIAIKKHHHATQLLPSNNSGSQFIILIYVNTPTKKP